MFSDRYRENGNPDTAGMVMEKAAKSVPHSISIEGQVMVIYIQDYGTVGAS